jgi:hypothetical protein
MRHTGAEKPTEKIITVYPMCHWCDSSSLIKLWDKMSMGGGRWGRVQLVPTREADYYVIINSPLPGTELSPEEKKKTIIFRMEPKMTFNTHLWGEYANPDDSQFLKVFRHENGDYNNNEWHLSKTYTELMTESIEKKYDKVLSTVLSDKYHDPGHVKRVDFIKHAESSIDVHVYGGNKWDYKDYKGPLPPHQKDEAIFPYKYVFNCENFDIPYYYTEKLIDGILGECLVFYSGCPNIRELIDPRAYIELKLCNFSADTEAIKKAMEQGLYEKRLPYIREAKKKILTEMQFFPRLEKFLLGI